MWKRLKTMEKTFRLLDWSWGDEIPLVLILLSTLSKPPLPGRSKGCSGIHRKTIPCINHCNAGIYVLPWNQTVLGPDKKILVIHSDRCMILLVITSGGVMMDASRFRPLKYYRTGAGEEWASIDPDRISHCTSGQSFCRKFNCSDDNGIRNYGNHVGCNGVPACFTELLCAVQSVAAQLH